MTGRLVRRSELDAATRARMRALLSSHFEGITAEAFERDLAEKNWALLLERGGALVGFSTLALHETVHRGEPLAVVYSGDTIVAPEAWSSPALPGSWIAAVRALGRGCPERRLFWLLISSGFRTFRLMSCFWRDYHHPGRGASANGLGALAEALARERFGDRYDAATGIVRLADPQRLRPHLAKIPPGKRRDPDVVSFLERNPGWAGGDELVCLAEVAYEKLTPAGRRMWQRGRCEGAA